jgi:hypothetical protein
VCWSARDILKYPSCPSGAFLNNIDLVNRTFQGTYNPYVPRNVLVNSTMWIADLTTPVLFILLMYFHSSAQFLLLETFNGWETQGDFSSTAPLKYQINLCQEKIKLRIDFFNTWGFHGGEYEKCGLLGYKNPVHTSQETHYASAIEASQLLLCKIWGFHGGDCEECLLMVRVAVSFL